MLPFGSVPFGQGYFGHGDWGRRVFWENVPSEIRDKDVTGYLEDLLTAFADESQALLQKIIVMPLQRDSYLVRASDGEEEWIYVTGCTEDETLDYGQVINLTEERDEFQFPFDMGAGLWTPYTAIQRVGPGWTVRIGNGDFKVVTCRTRNFDFRSPVDLFLSASSIGNEVWLESGPILTFAKTDEVVGTGDDTVSPLLELADVPLRLAYHKHLDEIPVAPPEWSILWYDGDPAWGLKLTMPLMAGPLVLYDIPARPYDGTGTLCAEWLPAWPGYIDPSVVYGTVNYETGAITLDVTPSGSTVADGADITLTCRIRGYYFKMFPPRIIDYLALDYGFENDRSDPEESQRSTIAHLTSYFGCKGAQDSYRIRGEISWLNVVATGLWTCCDHATWLTLPSDHTWTYDGLYYTDIEPRFIRFDDIAADVQYWDHDAAVWVPVLDNAFIHDDASPDGWSTGKAFACDVAQGYYVGPPATVLDAVALTPGELLALGLPFGYRVTVSMTQAQKDAYTFRKGRFGLSQYDFAGGVPPDYDLTLHPVYWIDAEDTSVNPHGWDPGALTWTVLIGAATVPISWPVGAPGVRDVAVRYYPEVSLGDCCYCRSYKMRVTMAATADALAFYETGDGLWNAYRRMMFKVENQLLPIQARIIDYEVVVPVELSRVFEGHDDSEELVAGEFQVPSSPDIDVYQVTLGLEQLGDLDVAGKAQDFRLQGWDETTSLWVDVLAPLTSFSGFSDATTWYPVAGYDPATPADVTAPMVGLYSRWRVLGKGSDTCLVVGSQRWTFTIRLKKV